MLAFCLGLTSAGAGCAVAGDDAPSLGGPPRATQGGGTVTGTVGGDWSIIDVLGPGAEVLEGVYTNGLSAEALTRNALISNVRANRAMVMLPLATETYADDSEHKELYEHELRLDPKLLRYRLRHKETRDVMRYLVSCALEPGQSVSYTDTRTGESYEFPGEIGLCPPWGDKGLDELDGAGVKCRQLVSACLLSRVNPTGHKVVLSMRGQAFPEHRPELLTPAPSVRVVTGTEDNGAIASFAPCQRDAVGRSRKCGWTSEHVGTCSEGSIVYIGAGSEPLGECEDDAAAPTERSDNDTIVRVCDGIRGCEAGSPDELDQREVRCSGRSEPALRFECRSSGYFSVMSGPRAVRRMREGASRPPSRGAFTVASRPPPPDFLDAMPTGGGITIEVEPAPYHAAVYPAQEADVFRWREGAFYGDLWLPGSLHTKLTDQMNEVSPDGTFHAAPHSGVKVFQHAFACTGEYWNDHVAYEQSRLCAGLDDDCVATSVGACGDSHAIANCPPLDQCAVDDGRLVEGDGDFQQCVGDSRTWNHPITVYLNKPSDVVRRPSLLVPDLPILAGPRMPISMPLCP
ncbi:hypothetical protein AB3662_24690 [Sorangium cellulosum]|uniref:hypothetical protein n=1 Tax=Sorangium cellulosum TaxID=56 RepID=UPI003D9A6792